jgi:hypothetical protein
MRCRAVRVDLFRRGGRLACRLFFIGTLLAAPVVGQVPMAAETSEPRDMVASAARIEAEAPRLDGRLDEAAWQQGRVITDFTQVEPVDGARPSERTEVHIVYDDEALYVGARMYDSDPGEIAGRLGRRDSYTSSDLFRVAIDSYHDHRTAFKFVVNPAGVRVDEVAANDNEHGDGSWDPIWEVATRVDDEGWVAELRIPFSQLRFSTDPVQEWGFNFSREIFRKSEVVSWSWARNTEQGYASLFGHVSGLRDIPQPRRVEALPYVTTKGDFDQGADPSSPFNDGRTGSMGFGVDLKYGLTSDLTLDATVNPDFGQVEADPAVVNLSAYETFFQERRPFFVEGANIFRFGAGSGGFVFGAPRLFYSRRVGRAPSRPASEPDGFVDNPNATSILGAVKLSGQTGGWSIGVMDALTSQEHANIQAPDGARSTRPVEPRTNFGVIGVRRDFRDGRSGVGVMGTTLHRSLSDPVFDGLRRAAYSGGVDFFHRFADNQWALNGTVSASHIVGDATAMLSAQRSSARYFQRPDQDHVALDSAATSMTGYATSMTFGKVAGRWTVGTDLFAYSPGLEVNDAGFQTQTDQIFHGIRLSRRWLDPGRFFRSAELNATWAQQWNFGGTRLGRSAYLGTWLQLLNYWSVSLGGNYSPGSLSDRATRGGPLMASPAAWSANAFVSSDHRKPVHVGVSSNYRRDEYGGWRASVGPNVTLRPSGAMNVRLSTNYTASRSTGFYVTQREDATAVDTYGGRYLFAELEQDILSATVRADIALSPTLTIQWYAQPFIASGDYAGFKELRAPRTYDFLRYGRDGASTLSYDGEEGSYEADPDGPGPAPGISFDNPDFSFRSLQSNLVMRWEYVPGSTLFLVWNHGRSGFSADPTFNGFGGLGDLMDDTMRNTFMIKVNYWLSG